MNHIPYKPGKHSGGIYLPVYAARTQKARGILDAIYDTHTFAGTMPPPATTIFPWSIQPDQPFPVFARPCPISPRHGFVDSRVVNSWQELIALYREAVEAENGDVEVILQRRLSGLWSGVATNAGVTWGLRNDGVTGATSSIRTIPTNSRIDMWRKHYRTKSMSDETIGITDTPYVELVEDAGKATVTQFRDGPEQVVGQNYIPRPVTVNSVLTPSPKMSLLSWEALVHMPRFDQNAVVWLPYGALSSHFAVHAILAGMPVLTSPQRPAIGAELQPEGADTPPLTQDDYVSLATRIKALRKQSYFPEDPNDQTRNGFNQRAIAATVVGTVHSQAIWGNEPHLLQLRAYAVDGLFRLIYAACLGEMRHVREAARRGRRPQTRVAIYAKNLRAIAVKEQRAKLEQALAAFQNNFLWYENFGGPAWAAVAKQALLLSEQTDAFLSKPTAATWTALMEAQNHLLHTAHNNGKTLTKWLGILGLNLIGEAPTLGFMNHFAANVALEGVTK